MKKEIAILGLISIMSLGLIGCEGDIQTVERTTDDIVKQGELNTRFVLNCKPLVSSDISDIAKEYDLNNTGNAASELVTEKLLLTYDANGNITRCSNRTSKLNSRVLERSSNIPSIDLYTEYGKNELGYNTVSHIEFVGTQDVFESVKEYFENITFSGFNKAIDDEYNSKVENLTIKCDNGIIKILERSTKNSGILRWKIDVYYNLNILNESYIDTVRLGEYEQLIKNSSIKELENYDSKSKIDCEKVLNIGNEKDEEDKFRVNTIEITRDWVKEKEGSLNFKVYSISKEYVINYKDALYKVTLHIDDYDRFNMYRLKYLSVAGNTIDNCKSLITNWLDIGEGQLESVTDNEKYIVSDNEGISLSKSSITEKGNEFIWYITYAIYDRPNIE